MAVVLPEPVVVPTREESALRVPTTEPVPISVPVKAAPRLLIPEAVADPADVATKFA